MTNHQAVQCYRYDSSEAGHHHGYLLPTVFETLDSLALPAGERHLFELGCGNGSMAYALSQRGWQVTGVDPSAEGIAQARAAYPEINLETGSAYDDLVGRNGRFPVVLSLEVVEHVYSPRDYARTVFDLLSPGGGGGGPSLVPHIMATGRISRWRRPARWTRTSPPCGITAIPSSGR